MLLPVIALNDKPVGAALGIGGVNESIEFEAGNVTKAFCAVFENVVVLTVCCVNS